MSAAAAATPPQLTLSERIGATHPDGSVSWFNGLFFGEPSSGKTYLSGTAEEWPEEFLPALVLDIDGGTDTIRNRYKVEVSPPIRSLDKLKEIYREIAADCTKAQVEGRDPYYKSIHIDNVSELQKIDMNEVMLEAKAQANNPDKIDIYVPSPREWGKSGERMRIIIRAFRDLPCHTICLAHMEEREDETTKIKRLWPALPGQLRTGLSGFFSVVGYISVYDGPEGLPIRQIQFAKTRRVAAKDRFQVLPDVMKDNPTLPEIWRIIKESGATIKDTDVLSVDPPAIVPAALAPAQEVSETVSALKAATQQ
jgi:hypothetical protein